MGGGVRHGLLGQRQESSREVVATGGVAADQEDGVVAGDGAQDVGVLGLVERRGEELRGSGRGPQYDEVGTARRR